MGTRSEYLAQHFTECTAIVAIINTTEMPMGINKSDVACAIILALGIKDAGARVVDEIADLKRVLAAIEQTGIGGGGS